MLALLVGIGLGLSLAAPPGPMNALIAREASHRGAASGIRIGMGAPAADVVWLGVLLFGLGRLLDGSGVLRTAAAIGSILMMHFAYDTWVADARRAADRSPTFLAGFAAALTNPYQAAWWLSGGYAFLASQGPMIIVGLLVGIFGWVLAFSWLVAHGAQRWRWFTPLIRFASTFLLLGFSMLLAAVAMAAVAI